MQDFFKGCIYFYASFQIQMRWATPDSITGFWIGNGYFSYIFFYYFFLLSLSCSEKHLFLVLEARTGFVSLPVVSDSYLKLL